MFNKRTHVLIPMNRLIITTLTLFSAASMVAQASIGSVVFDPGPGFHVWSPSPTDPTLALVGFGSNDTPPGTTPYAENGMFLIGAHGLAGQYGAATTWAQLIGAPGANVAQSSMVPLGQVTTFRTGSQAGEPVSITDFLSGLPGISPDAPVASFEIVVWDNSSGLYGTWTQASPAWLDGFIAAGTSLEFDVAGIGGLVNLPPTLDSMGAIPSFNIHFIPEPATMALGGLSAATLLVLRRLR